MSSVEKKEKEKRILATAADLFREGDFDSVSIASIARDAGIAKGTVFLYFTSKEELFLSLTEQYLQEWVGDAGTYLVSASLEGAMELEAAAEIFAASLGAKEDLLRLLGILHPRLLPGCSAEVLNRYRSVWLETIASLESVFSQAAPSPRGRSWGEILQDLYVLIIGVQGSLDLRENGTSAEQGFVPLFRRLSLEYLRGLASGLVIKD